MCWISASSKENNEDFDNSWLNESISFAVVLDEKEKHASVISEFIIFFASLDFSKMLSIGQEYNDI